MTLCAGVFGFLFLARVSSPSLGRASAMLHLSAAHPHFKLGLPPPHDTFLHLTCLTPAFVTLVEIAAVSPLYPETVSLHRAQGLGKPKLARYFRIVPTYVDIPDLGTVEGTLYPSARVFQACGLPEVMRVYRKAPFRSLFTARTACMPFVRHYSVY